MPTTHLDAGTLLAQLGGNKFLAMTGAKNLLKGYDFLQMDLPASLVKDRANRLTVRLNGLDLYDLELTRVTKRGMEIRTVAEVCNVPAEAIRRVFTGLTGLDTHL
jgi:hypothetical protein